MRTFFSIAALLGFTQAIKQDSADVDNSGGAATVDPWAQCRADIERLDDDVTSLEEVSQRDLISLANLEA